MQHSAPQPLFNGSVPSPFYPQMQSQTVFGSDEEIRKPEKQISGMAVVSAFLLYYFHQLYEEFMAIHLHGFSMNFCICIIILVLKIAFFCAVLFVPTYAAGKPEVVKFLPFALASLVFFFVYFGFH